MRFEFAAEAEKETSQGQSQVLMINSHIKNSSHMKNRFYDLIEIIAHLLQAINKKVPTNLGLQQNCSVLLKMSYCI